MDQDTAPKEPLTEAKISPKETPVDPQFTGVAPGKTGYPVQDLKFTVDGFGPSPGETLGGMEHSMFGNTDTINGNINYQDLMTWSHYPLDLDMYSMGSELSGSLVTAGFLESSETSSNSDPMFSGSLHPSPAMSHTKSASISSQSDANRQAKMVDIAVPILTDNSVVDFELLVAAESAWPLARCNPRLIPGPSTRTAIAYLENLEQHSKHDATWKSLDHDVEPAELQYGNGISVMPHNEGCILRLVYNWVMVDQELSLFHDTAPIMSITELETPMPGLECLWLAKDANEWSKIIQQTYIGNDWLLHPNPKLNHYSKNGMTCANSMPKTTQIVK
ncbi:hypothetical protein SS1G_11792 [Sclerotinia sclerotiorum 1980 UF-70]|uniref:Transcription factor domain-containing protein n=1 Tax=Sclerotinia sclerotiorum (strain ATCC 18683 / 1980 / Ss-1) TaxID=665079 RepID=A7F3E6_SCLS1|nr:hypothetical protein SS1G_11792 [Sclerotinia sclerotiorum 1980 UF-70]EDN97267.1 hypothetical protein SS1G_11792 [Sclerotinia sclerotiorum 1980 UF-70]